MRDYQLGGDCFAGAAAECYQGGPGGAYCADWLLRERCHPEPVEGSRHCRAFLEIQKYISPEVVSEGISDEVPP